MIQPGPLWLALDPPSCAGLGGSFSALAAPQPGGEAGLWEKM